MKKIIVIALGVVAIAAAAYCGVVGYSVRFKEDAILVKFERDATSAQSEAADRLEEMREQVANAARNYNEVSACIEDTRKQRNRAAEIQSECDRRLEFLQTHQEQGLPIHMDNGQPAKDEDIQRSVDELEGQMKIATDAIKAYDSELTSLEKCKDVYKAWAKDGPARIKILEQKYANMRTLFSIQHRRLSLIGEGSASKASLQDAYDEAMRVLNKASGEFNGELEVSSPKIDFSANNDASPAAKSLDRIKKIRETLGGGEVKSSNSIQFE